MDATIQTTPMQQHTNDDSVVIIERHIIPVASYLQLYGNGIQIPQQRNTTPVVRQQPVVNGVATTTTTLDDELDTTTNNIFNDIMNIFRNPRTAGGGLDITARPRIFEFTRTVPIRVNLGGVGGVQPQTDGDEVENTGLSINQINTYTNLNTAGNLNMAENVRCNICFTEFNENDICRIIRSCNHFFHYRCIDRWCSSHRTCPLCRARIDVMT